MKTTVMSLCLTLALVCAMRGDSVPKGMEQIYSGIEPGKPFHAFWPPVSGQNVLGTVVVASAPNKPQAFFQTIDSPAYRNPSYTKGFIQGRMSYTAGEVTQQKTIGVDVAFSQLDSILQSVKQTAQPESLAGQPTQAPASSEPAKVTGVDFNRFTNAAVKASGLQVIYYDLPTLMDIDKNHALTPGAEMLLTKDQKGWFIHRVLAVESLEYTLTANTKLEAGFFAKLVAWIPTVSVEYKNDRTVTLKTSSPLTIGYKLWRPGTGFEGEAVTNVDLAAIGLGADAIDKVLAGK